MSLNGSTKTLERKATNETKKQQLAERRKKRGRGEIADWALATPELLSRAIAAVTKHGLAVTLGYTKDSGAYAFRVIGDDAFETEYIRPTEDLDLFLAGVIEDFEA